MELSFLLPQFIHCIEETVFIESHKGAHRSQQPAALQQRSPNLPAHINGDISQRLWGFYARKRLLSKIYEESFSKSLWQFSVIREKDEIF